MKEITEISKKKEFIINPRYVIKVQEYTSSNGF